MFIRYANLNGNSNVESYELGDDSITVKFYRTAKLYTYSCADAGVRHVENMKMLAQRGYGLNGYIMRYVRTAYDY